MNSIPSFSHAGMQMLLCLGSFINSDGRRPACMLAHLGRAAVPCAGTAQPSWELQAFPSAAAARLLQAIPSAAAASAAPALQVGSSM